MANSTQKSLKHSHSLTNINLEARNRNLGGNEDWLEP